MDDNIKKLEVDRFILWRVQKWKARNPMEYVGGIPSSLYGCRIY